MTNPKKIDLSPFDERFPDEASCEAYANKITDGKGINMFSAAYDSHIPLRTWLKAVYLLTQVEMAITGPEFAELLGVEHDDALKMVQAIRPECLVHVPPKGPIPFEFDLA